MIQLIATLVSTYLPEKEEGQGLVEYALIIALVSILLVFALTTMKNSLKTVFATISSALTGASTATT